MDNHHMMIEGLIYLGSAALFVPIAVRLGLGSVLGYLIAGCIIGPWGLKLVSDAESILTFAEIGVVLMLFIIGLELDPKRLWTLRASVFGGGSIQMVGCGLALSAFCYFLGLNWKVALLIGLTLALSSTAIAMQAMSERNLTPSPIGRSAFAVLLFQDIAAIPLVAMIPLLASSGATTTLGAFVLSAAKVVGALTMVVLLGRYVTRPLLHFVARSGMREVFSAVALFLVFGFGILLEDGRAVDGDGGIPRRGAVGELGIPPRAGERYSAVQGAAAGAVLYRRRHVDRFRHAVPSSAPDRLAAAGLYADQGGAAVADWAADRRAEAPARPVRHSAGAGQ